MRRLLPLAALLVIGGCGADGDRGEPAPAASLAPPISKDRLAAMPAQARASAQASMDRGAAMKAQYEKQYGVH